MSLSMTDTERKQWGTRQTGQGLHLRRSSPLVLSYRSVCLSVSLSLTDTAPQRRPLVKEKNIYGMILHVPGITHTRTYKCTLINRRLGEEITVGTKELGTLWNF